MLATSGSGRLMGGTSVHDVTARSGRGSIERELNDRRLLGGKLGDVDVDVRHTAIRGGAECEEDDRCALHRNPRTEGDWFPLTEAARQGQRRAGVEEHGIPARAETGEIETVRV